MGVEELGLELVPISNAVAIVWAFNSLCHSTSRSKEEEKVEKLSPKLVEGNNKMKVEINEILQSNIKYQENLS